MNRYLASAAALLLIAVGACNAKQADASSAAANPASATAQNASAATTVLLASGAAVAPPPEDLFAFSAGTRFVQKPDDSDYAGMAYTPYALLDETPATDTRTEAGKPAAYVLELPEQTAITRLGFDTGGMTNDDKAVRGVRVEMSDTSATSGFTPVLNAELKQAQNNQMFDLPQKAVGRWVRLTFLSNFGAENYGMTGFHGYGQRLTNTATVTDVSGTYEGASGWGDVHLKQEGTRVIGCFKYRHGTIAAGVDGRLLKGEMVEYDDDGTVTERSLALFAFAPGNKALFVLSRASGWDPANGFDAFWSAEKVSNDIGDCPQIPGWRGQASGSALGAELESRGRARLDGVNFDFNSAVIQPASYGLLDQVAELLREHEDWKITLEGHTDNVGTAAFNKALSSQRASAVQSYLVSKGVTAGRLTSAGFGFDKPVASNDTQGGRAQNRRVEIVKQ